MATTAPEAPHRAYHEFWFTLAKKAWRSLVLVPADIGTSVSAVASSLAKVGNELHDEPVTLFTMEDPADYWPAVELARAAANSDREVAATPAAVSVDCASAAQAVAAAARQQSPPQVVGKVIIAIQPVITEPLGLAVTQSVDAVVLCVELGRTRIASTRRTIELIGRSRIVGCHVESSRRHERHPTGSRAG